MSLSDSAVRHVRNLPSIGREGASAVSSYKVRARSVIHPGNFLVEHRDGTCWVFFADVGELSATAIDSSLAEAMVQSYEWSCHVSDEWVTLAELGSHVPAHHHGKGHANGGAHPES